MYMSTRSGEMLVGFTAGAYGAVALYTHLRFQRIFTSDAYVDLGYYVLDSFDTQARRGITERAFRRSLFGSFLLVANGCLSAARVDLPTPELRIGCIVLILVSVLISVMLLSVGDKLIQILIASQDRFVLSTIQDVTSLNDALARFNILTAVQQDMSREAQGAIGAIMLGCGVLAVYTCIVVADTVAAGGAIVMSDPGFWIQAVNCVLLVCFLVHTTVSMLAVSKRATLIPQVIMQIHFPELDEVKQCVVVTYMYQVARPFSLWGLPITEQTCFRVLYICAAVSGYIFSTLFRARASRE